MVGRNDVSCPTTSGWTSRPPIAPGSRALRRKSRSALSFHLRKRIKATRDLIRLLEAERATMKDDAENRDRAPRASLDDESGDDEETEPRASMSAGESRR